MVHKIIVNCASLGIPRITHRYFSLLFQRYDYRIKYLNLKKTRSQNALSLEDVHRLWIPFLVFDNTEKNEATKVKSSISFLHNLLREQRTPS